MEGTLLSHDIREGDYNPGPPKILNNFPCIIFAPDNVQELSN